MKKMMALILSILFLYPQMSVGNSKDQSNNSDQTNTTNSNLSDLVQKTHNLIKAMVHYDEDQQIQFDQIMRAIYLLAKRNSINPSNFAVRGKTKSGMVELEPDTIRKHLQLNAVPSMESQIIQSNLTANDRIHSLIVEHVVRLTMKLNFIQPQSGLTYPLYPNETLILRLGLLTKKTADKIDVDLKKIISALSESIKLLSEILPDDGAQGDLIKTNLHIQRFRLSQAIQDLIDPSRLLLKYSDEKNPYFKIAPAYYQKMAKLIDEAIIELNVGRDPTEILFHAHEVLKELRESTKQMKLKQLTVIELSYKELSQMLSIVSVNCVKSLVEPPSPRN